MCERSVGGQVVINVINDISPAAAIIGHIFERHMDSHEPLLRWGLEASASASVRIPYLCIQLIFDATFPLFSVTYLSPFFTKSYR